MLQILTLKVIFGVLMLFSYTQTAACAKTPPVPPKHSESSQTAPNKIPVLMFHYVRHIDPKKDPLGYNLSIEAKNFEKILKRLKQSGYNAIHAQDILANKIPSKAITLTFDDGYMDFYTTAWPLLKKYQLTASVAIISGKMDGKQYMSPQNVREIHQNGIEILSHTVNHVDLTRSSNAKSEIEKSKNALEKLLGAQINGFIYPSSKYNQQTIRILKNADYKIAFTTKPGLADLNGNLFELKRIRVDNRVGIDELMKKMTNNQIPISR